jgi:hypothetical protein
MRWGVHRRRTWEGLDTMGMILDDAETGIESQLIDLTAIPFALLRRLDNFAVRHALHQVVAHTESVRALSRSGDGGGGGGERID